MRDILSFIVEIIIYLHSDYSPNFRNTILTRTPNLVIHRHAVIYQV